MPNAYVCLCRGGGSLVSLRKQINAISGYLMLNLSVIVYKLEYASNLIQFSRFIGRGRMIMLNHILMMLRKVKPK